MTTTNAWVWPALERMVGLQQQRDAAKAEAERLQKEFDEEYERIQVAVPGATLDILVNTLDAMRLFGSPMNGGGLVSDTRPDAADGDPLEIPSYLRRTAGSGDDGPTQREQDADAVARGAAP